MGVQGGTLLVQVHLTERSFFFLICFLMNFDVHGKRCINFLSVLLLMLLQMAVINMTQFFFFKPHLTTNMQ